jgi:hypothetical protein
MPIVSDKNQACCLCSGAINEAEVITPLMAEESNAPNQKYQLVYAHPGCVTEQHTPRIPVCKHWQTKGVCVYQSSCQFRHPPEEAGSLAKTRGRSVPPPPSFSRFRSFFTLIVFSNYTSLLL